MKGANVTPKVSPCWMSMLVIEPWRVYEDMGVDGAEGVDVAAWRERDG